MILHSEIVKSTSSKNVPVIWIEETYFHLYCSKTQERSKKESICSFVSVGVRVSNIHVIGYIGIFGLIDDEIKRE